HLCGKHCFLLISWIDLFDNRKQEVELVLVNPTIESPSFELTDDALDKIAVGGPQCLLQSRLPDHSDRAVLEDFNHRESAHTGRDNCNVLASLRCIRLCVGFLGPRFAEF